LKPLVALPFIMPLCRFPQSVDQLLIKATPLGKFDGFLSHGLRVLD
jgi:hypothetical protein